jgi:hypothetical protein
MISKAQISNLCSSAFVCGSLLLGCRAPSPAPYYGPTEPLNQLVARINANNQQVPTLHGEGHFDASFKTEGKPRSVQGELTLNYSYPRSLSFIGKDLVLGRILEVGSNDSRYWVVAGPRGDERTRMWWGAYKNINRVKSNDLPVQPDALIEVLGVQPIETDFLQPAAPVLRFNNDADAYMIVWSIPLQDRWAAQKEIWYDRKTKLPTLVLLFDKDGRIMLRAYLLNHQPVEVAGTPKDRWPKVATEYRLFFPDSGSTVRFYLKDALALKKGSVPNARTFAFPVDIDAIPHVIELDEQQGIY